MSSKVKVCIIGAESWGSAIATAVGDNVCDSEKFDQRVRIYVFEEYVGDNKLADVINETHENIKYLPGIPLPTNLVAVGDLIEAVEDADIIVFATPQRFVKPYCNRLAGHVKQSAIAVSLVKGFERINDGGIHLFSQAISNQLGIPCYSLVGANCAMEMAQGKICELTIGCDNATHSELLKEIFQTTNCQVISIDDVKGVELVGTLKDIIALGAGLVDGLRLGDNARVAVLHLGLKEMMRFVKGFYPTTKLSTFFEGCGVADLVTSCYADKNVQFAKAFVASGKTIQELEESAMNGKKLLGPLIAEEVAGFLAKQNMSKQFPLFTAVHKICQNEQPPESIIEAVRTHPDVNNLTISKLMNKEQADKDLAPHAFECADDTTYEPLTQFFLEDDQNTQEFQTLVQKAESKETPSLVAEAGTKHEMKSPIALHCPWVRSRSSSGKSTLDKLKGNKKSNNFFMSGDDDDKLDKNDWMADDEWRPQDLSRIPKPQPTQSPKPIQKFPEAKARLAAAAAEDLLKGDLFNRRDQSDFRDPHLQLFDHYKPVQYLSDTVQHQVGNEEDSVSINVTAEMDGNKAGKGETYYVLGDYRNETEPETEKSIESLKEAVQALDQLDDGKTFSNEDFAVMYKKATEEPSISQRGFWQPMGESGQREKATKASDGHLPQDSAREEWHQATDDVNEINLSAKDPDGYSAEPTGTWQPLRDAKDEGLPETQFSESSDHSPDWKKGLSFADDLDAPALTTPNSDVEYFDPKQQKQNELDANTELLSSAEVATMMESPSEFEENAQEAQFNLSDDAKLYQVEMPEFFSESKSLDLSDKGADQNHIYQTPPEYRQKGISQAEVATHVDEEVRADTKHERDANYWFLYDGTENEQKQPESRNESDDLLTKYFERNDDPRLTEPTKYMDTEWDLQNYFDKEKKREDTNKLNMSEQDATIEEKTGADTKQKVTTTTTANLESSNEKEATVDSKGEAAPEAKSDKLTTLEGLAKKSIGHLFSMKKNPPKQIEAIKELESKMHANEAEEINESESGSKFERFNEQAFEELDGSIDAEMPMQNLRTDLESLWQSGLENESPEKVGIENLNTNKNVFPTPFTPADEMVEEKRRLNRRERNQEMSQRREPTTATTKRETPDANTLTPAKRTVSPSREIRVAKQRPSTELAQKYERLQLDKRPRRQVKETAADVDYKGDSPYNAEPRLRSYDAKMKGNSAFISNDVVRRRDATKRPPFNPPFNPKMKIPRPPFDGREHEYHTFAFSAPRQLAGPTCACAKSSRLRYIALSKAFHAAPRSKQFKSFFGALKLTRATKILCAIQFGVIAALLNNLGED